MDLVFDISINLLLLNDVEFLFLLLLLHHLKDLGVKSFGVICFRATETTENLIRGLPKCVIIYKICMVLLRWFGKLIEVLNKSIPTLFCHLKISPFTWLVSQIYWVEIGKEYIHFANIFKKFSSIKGCFRLSKYHLYV